MSELIHLLEDNWSVIIENKWLFASMSVVLLGIGYKFGRFISGKKISTANSKIEQLSADNRDLHDETVKLRDQLRACSEEAKILAAKRAGKQHEAKHNVAKSFATSSK